MRLSEKGLETKKNLQAVLKKHRLLNSLAEAIRTHELNISCLAGGTGPLVKSSAISDTTASYVFKLQSLRDRYAKVLTEIMNIEDKISESLDFLCEDEQAIIIDRYLNGLKFEDVADKWNYSVRQVYRIHNNAIEKISNIDDIDFD